jgi:glyoxylase-like metal-dependent hydrolase (beta-lactamase superfamily II)
MFGIIPRPLWEKKLAPDERHRVHLGTNCLLMRDGERVVLVDNGMGDKWSEKQADIFATSSWPLLENLSAHGVAPEQVTDLVLTHLHFDHAGGTTRRGDDGQLRLTFENARVHVGRRNFEHALQPNERDRGSYRDENWAPLLEDKDRLVLHDDVPGERMNLMEDLSAFVCEGHTDGQVIPLVGAKDRRGLYAADMIPTRAHVRLPWNMSYDLRPTQLMKEKRALLELCADEGAVVIFEHDPERAVQGVVRDRDDFALASVGGTP